MEQHKINKHWKPHDHKTGFVYRPYYYFYHDDPYYESVYISNKKEIYDPTIKNTRTIKLNDGTIIEGFGNYNNFIIIILLLILLLFV